MKSYHDIVGDGGSNVAGQVEEQQRRLELRLAPISHVVAVMSGKGGVGKSSLAVNIASALAISGRRVGLMDADINGASIVKMTGVRREPESDVGGVRPPVSGAGVKVMSIDLFTPENEPVKWDAPTQKDAFTWRGMMEQAALREMVTDTEWGDLDYLLVDLPPGTDRLPNLADLLPQLSAAVVVTVPSTISHYVVAKSIQTARELMNLGAIGLVENMSGFVCPECGKSHDLFHGEDAQVLAGRYDVTFLGRVPMDPRMAWLTDRGLNFLGEHGDRPAAQAVGQVARSVEKLVASVGAMEGKVGSDGVHADASDGKTKLGGGPVGALRGKSDSDAEPEAAVRSNTDGLPASEK